MALQLLVVSQPQGPPGSSSSSSSSSGGDSGSGRLRLVGFGSSSHSSDLLAEFMDAAACSSSSRQSSRADGAQRAAGKQRGKAAKVSSRGAAVPGASHQHGSGHEAAEHAPAALLRQLLQLLPLVVQQPLLLQEACRIANTLCEEQGAVHAAAMFLHMSLGKQGCSRHALLACTRCLEPRGDASAECWLRCCCDAQAPVLCSSRRC
jgi:hypothetical protein